LFDWYMEMSYMGWNDISSASGDTQHVHVHVARV